MNSDSTGAPSRRPQWHISDPNLSLWQSAVRHVAARRASKGDVSSSEIVEDPWVLAVDSHVRHHLTGIKPDGAATDQLSTVATVMADVEARVRLEARVGLGGLAGRVADWWLHLRHRRPYSDYDPNFLECVTTFVEWYWLRLHSPMYRDWVKDGDKDPHYADVASPLPASGSVVLIGDWGTGLDDSAALLSALLKARPPVIAVVHLGDIYYSGTPEETRYNFEAIVTKAMDEALGQGKRVPVFTIPGNHDYYCGGSGFYELIDRLNSDTHRQRASFFRIATEDERWQLVGLDTGFNDRGLPGLPPFRRAPALHDSEVEWARHTIEGFGGRTILLTHHQLFSATQRLNGVLTLQSANVNDHLREAIDPVGKKVAAWFWGHEHCLMVFNDGLYGIERSRLIGCSAFEVASVRDPYSRRFPEASFRGDVQLAKRHGWYNHGAAVITFPHGQVEYFQFPSWTSNSTATHSLEAFAFSEMLS